MFNKTLPILLGLTSASFSHYISPKFQEDLLELTLKSPKKKAFTRLGLSPEIPVIPDMKKTTKNDKFYPLKQRMISPYQPIISSQESVNSTCTTRIGVNPDFVRNTKVYAQMIDLSYQLVKGKNESSTELIEDLFRKGWEINAFGGFSGKSKDENYDATNRDLTGFIAFNKNTGEAVVTFHGSQDYYDWENNFDSQKVFSQENGLKFKGGVHKGINYRYQTAKQSIYRILDKFYNQLDNKDLFHITTTGHSLGGGTAVLSYADLASDYMKQHFGMDYNNRVHNRVRSFAVSPPRVLDAVSVEDLEKSVGNENIIIDAVRVDPIIRVGPGKSITSWLEGSFSYGITAGILSLLKRLDLVPYSHPQALAFSHGDYMHLGYKALAESGEVATLSKDLDQQDLNKQINSKNVKHESIFSRFKKSVKARFAHWHYGRSTSSGTGFEKSFIIGETLEKRINDTLQVNSKADFQPTSRAPWWQRILGLNHKSKV